MRNKVVPYLFILPSVIFFAVFLVGPLLFAAYISFRRWNMLVPAREARFVGLKNFAYLFTRDDVFTLSLANTLIFAVAMVLATMVLALMVALLLNAVVRFRSLFRTVYFIPVVTSMVAVSIVWAYIYHPSYGLLNELLGIVGLSPQPWLTSTEQALGAVVGMTVWKRLGYYTVIFVAGLQTIPPEMYDAASVDGASPWQQLWRITLPLLKPTTLFALVICTIEALQVFTQVFVMTQGGPANASNVVVVHMYNTAFNFLRMGRASAMAFVLFGIIFVITVIQMRLMREGVVVSY